MSSNLIETWCMKTRELKVLSFCRNLSFRDLSHLPKSVGSQQVKEASHKIYVVPCLVTDANMDRLTLGQQSWS